MITDKTQKLLFKGMNQLQTEKLALDTNDNVMLDCEPAPLSVPSSDPSLKQMCLGKNCQLVNEEVEMEDISCSKPNIADDALKSGQFPFLSNCSQFLLTGHSFSRAPPQLSPPSFPTPTVQKNLAIPGPQNSDFNVFQRMKMAQSSQNKLSSFTAFGGGESYDYVIMTILEEIDLLQDIIHVNLNFVFFCA